VFLHFVYQFLFPALHFDCAAGARWERRQHEDEIKIVIRCDAVEAFKVATETSVDKNILAVVALEATDWFHSAAAIAHAIPCLLIIDVTRVETKGAVIAVMAARRRRADKAMTMPAFECLFVG
jgi:hypothetical protein